MTLPMQKSLKPLAGMKVLDLTRALSGPFCTLILADLGAEVIKVEPVGSGDMIRSWGPFDRGESVYYLSANRNKKSLAVNFRSDAGRALLHKLALECDVVIENFKPGTMASMGMNPDELISQKPDLIFASVSGFGADGPLAHQPGFDQIAQGYSGLMSVTGTPETGPTRIGVAIGDLTSGMWTAIGILAAWVEKKQSGHGTKIETSLLGSLVGLLSVQGQRYLSLGEVPGPAGNVHPVIAPYGVFSTSNGDINIGAATQNMWINLCKVIHAEHLLDDPRFKDNESRMKHRNDLKKLIEEKLTQDTKEAWTSKLVEKGIPAGPINDIADVFANAQVVHSRLVDSVQHDRLGNLKQVGLPINFNGTVCSEMRSAPPEIGQHTHEILTEFGFSEQTITGLLKEGVISQYE